MQVKVHVNYPIESFTATKFNRIPGLAAVTGDIMARKQTFSGLSVSSSPEKEMVLGLFVCSPFNRLTRLLA
jgi:hypothetical protein